MDVLFVLCLSSETGILLVERRDPTQGATLHSWLNAHVFPTFSDRSLVVNAAVAQRCAKLYVPDPRSDRDALIAAAAIVHGMTIVTRNVDNFSPASVEIDNSWQLHVSK